MSHPSIRLPRYAAGLGIAVDHWDGPRPVLGVDYSETVRGFPGLFHGGALGGLLEMAAIAALQAELGADAVAVRLKPVNITVEYLRGAVAKRAFARGEVVRQGRRLANVRAIVWQDSPDKPCAIGFTNVLLAEPKG